jgi:hypothetical protein
MPRARTSRATSFPLTLAAVLLALLVVAPVAAAADGEDLPPVVSNGSVSPSSLPYLGGTVTIAADVVDDEGVAAVYAEVVGWDGAYQAVALAPTGGDAYSASVSVGPNFTDSPVSHTVTVVATDASGLTSSEGIGEIAVDGQPQFDEAPVVSDPAVEPRELSAAGGTVTIGVTAFDNRGIVEALAVVALPGGGVAVVTLEPISSSRFEGTFAVPPNAGTTPRQYAIEVYAYDEHAQSDMADAGVVTVAASRCPPRMPAWAAERARCGRAAAAR